MNTINETLQTKLKNLKTQLFNVSKKSNLLYPQQQGIQSLQSLAVIPEFQNAQSFLHALEQDNAVSFPETLDAKQIYQVNKLRTTSKREVKEYGNHSLKIALLQLQWLNELDEENWSTSPLYFLDISIKKKGGYRLIAHQKVLSINPVLDSILVKKWNIKLPKTISFASYTLTEIIALIQQHFEQNEKFELAYAPAHQSAFSKNNWTIFSHDLLIGNFNYHNINLVRDYNAILSASQLPPLLSTLLLEDSMPETAISKQALSPTELSLIKPADPSQEMAIKLCLNGGSLIIEGPPGTGKSETITNIIASHLAQHKKVLFISAKKTALKTVYAKLKKQQLAHLCALIHDSQNDKKAFIKKLQESYNEQVSLAFNSAKNQAEKSKQVQIFNQAELFLNRYAKHMQTNVALSSDFTVKQVIDNLLPYYTGSIKPKSIPFPQLPPFALFIEYSNILENLFTRLVKNEKLRTLTKHPIRFLSWEVFIHYPHAEGLVFELNKERQQLKSITDLAQQLPIPEDLLILKKMKIFQAQLEPYFYFWENDLSDLLNNKTEAFKQLQDDAALYHQLKEESLRLAKINKNWKQKFTRKETKFYLEIATRHEGTFAPFFYKNYRLLKKELNARYPHRFLAKKRAKKELLSLLKREYDVAQELRELSLRLDEKYGKIPVLELYKLSQEWQTNIDTLRQGVFRQCMSSIHNQTALHELFETSSACMLNGALLKTKHNAPINQELEQLEEVLSSFSYIEESFDDLSNLAKEPLLFDYFMSSSFTLEEVSFNLFAYYYSDYVKKHEDFKLFSAESLSHHSQSLQKAQGEIYRLNALEINAKQNDLFSKKIRLAHLSKQGLNKEEKELQSALKKGLQSLENEFTKSRSYQAIRLLNEGETKPLIDVLKPVWMMSPQSVADSLAFLPEQFDLVVFDEASQLSFEECIPSLYRAKNCLIVGDSMQLPPSTFFHKGISNSEGVADTKISLLEQAKSSLPSVSLKWHYRSRHEELISFNNAAFYQNTLKTIPAVKVKEEKFKPVHIDQVVQAAFTYQDIREKPLSFHYVNQSVYENGENEKEASYIAELVKHLLLSQKPLNLGILCPSLSQQEAIEHALSKITFFEQGFIELMNAKYQKDQKFDGIFIRNLENIQGEERDLIIVSMTYGPDQHGTLNLNFGPINSVEGEKRLNVLFSRAKEHLLVVSSMRSEDIKLNGNPGVRCLKNYLNFAEQLSLGNKDEVRELIKGLEPSQSSVPSWIISLSKEIENKGYHVEINYGYSSLKCSLAVKLKSDSEAYVLGLLTDDEPDFYNHAIRHSFVFQAAILKEFGWNIEVVLAKDFVSNKLQVVKQVLTRLHELQDPSAIDVVQEIEETDSAHATTFNEDKLLFTRLEKNEKDSLFWELAGNLHDIIIRYGKVGTKGKKLIKTYPSVAKVIEAKRKLIRQKEKLGYRRV